MTICFAKNQQFDDIKVEGTPIEIVQSAKLVGVHIQNDLKWNTHIDSIVKKSHTRIHFLVQLRRANVPKKGHDKVLSVYHTTSARICLPRMEHITSSLFI